MKWFLYFLCISLLFTEGYAFNPNDYMDSGTAVTSDMSQEAEHAITHAFTGESEIGIEFASNSEDHTDFYSRYLGQSTQSYRRSVLMHQNLQLSQTWSPAWSTRQKTSVWFISSLYKQKPRGSDSSDNTALLTELWLSADLNFPFTAHLSIGKKTIETGPGMSWSPSYQLPLKNFEYNSRQRAFEKRNAWSVQADAALTASFRLSARWFPELSEHWNNPSILAMEAQGQAFELQSDYRLKEDWYLSVGWYYPQKHHIEATSEFFLGSWVFHADVSGSRGSPLSTVDRNFILKNRDEKILLLSALGAQYDFAGIMNGYRISFELNYDARGWSNQSHKNFLSLLDSMKYATDSSAARFHRTLGELAGQTSMEQTYRFSGLLRLGSVSDDALNGSLNLIPYFSESQMPGVDGAIGFADLEYRFLDHFSVNGTVYRKIIFTKRSALRHLPLDQEWRAQLQCYF